MENKNIRWSGKSYGGRFGNACFAFLLRIGRTPAYALLVFVAAFFMLFRRRQCAESSKYLSVIFGKNIPPVSKQSYAHLFSFGRSIIDKQAYFSGANVEIDDKARAEIEKILEKGKGCVAVSSHIGGWAIAGGELAQYPCPTGVIGVSAEHEYISKMEEAHRRRNLPKMIATADDPFAMLAGLGILRKNGVVSVHGDRYIAGKFASVDFLGKKARFPVSAYALAEKSGASIAIVFCTREKSGAYTISVSRTIEPSSLPGASFQERSSAYAQAYADDIAKTLKSHPYQWYNFYPFWLQ